MSARCTQAWTERDQIDAAVALGLASPDLPGFQWVEELFAQPVERPPELVEGILHQGCKMVLSGTSKSNKSWCLIDLAVSVASGQPWWGRNCRQSRTVYINFELPPWAMQDRLAAIKLARPECEIDGERLAVWNLRGHSADLGALRPQLEDALRREAFGMVILDPAYKLLGERDENSNGEIAAMMNELELLAEASGAAVVLAHHFAKGQASAKEAIDRMSGAGAWARDPDALLVLTPHEEEDCFTVTSILRHLKRVPEFVLAWDYPVMRVAGELNPEALRSRGGRRAKVYRDAEFVGIMFGNGKPKAWEEIERDGSAMRLARSSVRRYLNRAVDCGTVVKGNGMYWRKEQ